MAQVTLYLDDETADRLKKAAKQAGLSRSRFLARLVREKTVTEWPQAVKDLAGAWPDLETVERRRRHDARDARRVKF
ncbi:MAG: CopG family transcriptional regulator [Acidobacteria bacterium]|nr:MAG: CopG family transcriptional regulator [Acidobacteriota bacterium]